MDTTAKVSAKIMTTPLPEVGDAINGIGAGDTVTVGVDVGVMVGVRVGVDVGVFVGVRVGVRVGVSVGVFVAVEVGVLVGVEVGVLVAVEVGVLVGVFVGVLVGVFVGVFVGVKVGVAVGVRVGVFVGVSVGVCVGVSVGVGVLVGVSVGVSVGVTVGSTSTPLPMIAVAAKSSGLECATPLPNSRPFADNTPGDTFTTQSIIPSQPIESPVPERFGSAQVTIEQPNPQTSLRSRQPVTGWPFAPGQQKRATMPSILQGIGATPRLKPKPEKCTVPPFETALGLTSMFAPNEVVQPGGSTIRSSADTARSCPSTVTRNSSKTPDFKRSPH